MTSQQTHVIVGASLAGARAAETLREEGFDGRVVLVGAEPERPYQRPPLSKDYLRGETPRERVFVHPEAFYREHDIELRTSTTANEIDPANREVILARGERIRFDRLLLTTGAAPRRLAIPGADHDNVLHLRTLADSDAIGARLAAGGRVVVVGAGWIGAEVAASARERGLEVTLIDPGATPLERVLGAEVGAVFRDLHRDHGVELLLGTGVESFEGTGSAERVVTSDGRRVDCDLVVVGIGVQPRTELAATGGLATENGIRVDERLESGVPGVFAAGDVANARHPLYGEHLRVEHWANARHQGPAAARGMLDLAAPEHPVPYFFSDQYEVGMEYTGHAARSERVLFRGDPATREFIAFWMAGDRILAGMNVGVGEVSAAIARLVRDRVAVVDERLTDPDVPLDAVARPSRPPRGARGPIRQALADGAGFPRRFVAGRRAAGEAAPLSEIAPGEGRVGQVDGRKLAVHRDDAGELHAVSAVCTHMGCVVGWNAGERTWDCPCHGSRFDSRGKVLVGPARRDLETVAVEQTPSAGTARA